MRYRGKKGEEELSSFFFLGAVHSQGLSLLPSSSIIQDILPYLSSRSSSQKGSVRIQRDDWIIKVFQVVVAPLFFSSILMLEPLPEVLN